jgi:hypothetical protein
VVRCRLEKKSEGNVGERLVYVMQAGPDHGPATGAYSIRSTGLPLKAGAGVPGCDWALPDEPSDDPAGPQRRVTGNDAENAV